MSNNWGKGSRESSKYQQFPHGWKDCAIICAMSVVLSALPPLETGRTLVYKLLSVNIYPISLGLPKRKNLFDFMYPWLYIYTFFVLYIYIDIHSVDSSWLAWGEWSHCSLSCGNGNRNRGRGCTGCKRVPQIDFHIGSIWKEESSLHILMLTCFPTLLSNSILQHLLLEDSTAQGALKRRSIATQFPVLVGFGHFWPPLLWGISFSYNISDQLVLNQQILWPMTIYLASLFWVIRFCDHILPSVSWSAWTRWSPCSRTCGTGQKVGLACSRSLKETLACLSHLFT